MHNTDVRRYLQEIKADIPCAGKRKRNILNRINGIIGGYLEENTNPNYNELTARFGTPKQIVSSYVEEMDTPELIKKLNIRRKIVGIVAAVAVTIVVTWLSVVAFAYSRHLGAHNGYFTEEIVNVVENQ